MCMCIHSLFAILYVDPHYTKNGCAMIKNGSSNESNLNFT